MCSTLFINCSFSVVRGFPVSAYTLVEWCQCQETSLGRSSVPPPLFFAFSFYDGTVSYYSARTVNEKSPSPFRVRGFSYCQLLRKKYPAKIIQAMTTMIIPTIPPIVSFPPLRGECLDLRHGVFASPYSAELYCWPIGTSRDRTRNRASPTSQVQFTHTIDKSMRSYCEQEKDLYHGKDRWNYCPPSQRSLYIFRYDLPPRNLTVAHQRYSCGSGKKRTPSQAN